MKSIITLLLILGIAGAGLGWWYFNSNGNHPTQFRTVPIERGDIQATISATGTIEPEEVIDVGAQVAGQIKNFGHDPHDSSKWIDYGSEVEENTILAQIDDAIYKSQLDQAKANLQKSEADLVQMRAKLRQAERDWTRARELGPRRAISDQDYDTMQATYETQKSALGVGEATVEQAKANLEQARINVGYTTIRSPVKGVIIDRRVNVGQTVVASLNAPSLFLIAKDLKRMEVWASVNEADVGHIHKGQPVKFTVDAFPGETFRGEVAQIRLNASMTQNVVTYTIVVATDNSSGRLLPYLTANLQFEVEKHSQVLLVPNGALRYRPKPEQMVPEARETLSKTSGRRPSGGGTDKSTAAATKPPSTARDKSERADKIFKAKAEKAAAEQKKAVATGKDAANPNPDKPTGERGTLWLDDNGFARPIRVRVGLTDGLMTEVQGEAVKEGMEVIVGEARPGGGAAGGTTNPFTPQFFGGKQKQQ
jgi:HlyD family secretion protein